MKLEQPCILVCDDQPNLRFLLSESIKIRMPSAVVVTAANGREAEELIRNQSFAAIFMDVEMPEQDGFTTLKNVRENKLAVGTPFIMCTGCRSEADLVKGWQLEATYYLTKPFDLDELETILEELVFQNIAA